MDDYPPSSLIKAWKMGNTHIDRNFLILCVKSRVACFQKHGLRC